MKYFTHNSDASKAVRLRKFVRRFGAEGYGVWWMLVEAAAEDMESCGGWLHHEFDMEELALNAGLESVSALTPMLDMLESLRDEDGLGLIVRGDSGRVGIPSLLHHLSEHLAKKLKRTSGDWVPFSGVMPLNSGEVGGNSNRHSEIGAETPEIGGTTQVLKERRGEERKGKENTPRTRPSAGVMDERFARFWAVVKKKVGKQQSRVEFGKVAPDEDLLAVMIRKMAEYSASKELQFQKDPERWIKGRRWEDEASSGAADQPDIFSGCENLRD